jgi:hypothetical protein
LVLVAVGLLASACGGKGSATGGEGAGGNVGDSAGGCSGGAADVCGGAGNQPPPAQGAFALSVKPLSPAPPGKACPSTGFTSEVPVGGGLDADTYLERVVDGEDGASVTCAVQGDSSFLVSANLRLGALALVVNGTIAADRRGEAEVTITDSQHLSGSLVGASCQLDAQQGVGTYFQVKAGSLWAGFSCAAVEAVPTSACAASGYFVIENCQQ